tara:strand:+ start:687 stop:1358 length:672 start_codon:yes stop_codon:yes gene_type:complete
MGVDKSRKNTRKNTRNEKTTKKRNTSRTRKGTRKGAFRKLKASDITEDEMNSLIYYTGGESLWINNLLTKTRIDELSDKSKSNIQGHIDNLNNIIKKSSPSMRKTVVYRGAQTRETTENWKMAKKGDMLPFNYSTRFISTTLNKKTALDFVEDDESCCLLKLILPKGTKGIYVTKLSSFQDLEEEEIILPPGCKFIVVDKGTMNKNGKKITTFTAILNEQLSY